MPFGTKTAFLKVAVFPVEVVAEIAEDLEFPKAMALQVSTEKRPSLPMDVSPGVKVALSTSAFCKIVAPSILRSRVARFWS